MGNNAYFGKITINEDNNAFVAGGVSGSLTAGNYYIYHPTEAYSLLDHLCDQIDTAASITSSFSISTSGILTISGSSAFALNFEDIGYEIYGFTQANLSSNTLHVGSKALKYCWFPERKENDSLVPTSRAGQEISVYSQQRAADGEVWTTKYGNLYDQVISYKHLPKAKVWQSSSADNSSYEEFFNTVASTGKKINFMPNYPTDDDTKFSYVVDLEKQNSIEATKDVTGYDGLYSLTINLAKVST